MKRFKFPLACLFLVMLFGCIGERGDYVMTVNGPLPASEMGITLTHEHLLVDFIGADSISESRWDKTEVAGKIQPYIKQAAGHGCRTLVDATPEYIGRDPVLLKMVSKETGVNIITNTGYYGAAKNKFLPVHAYSESAGELANRWISEWEQGIKGTGVKPGFIKIGVAGDSLSEMHSKLAEAAALTHLETGLTIASHTGPAIPAFQQIDVLARHGVGPDAFIWVHAQSEKDPAARIKAAALGAWVSLDGLNDNNVEEYAKMTGDLKLAGHLDRVLLSHDAGWYDPSKENGGEFRGYNTLFEKLVPRLRESGFTEKDIELLLVRNPARAFSVRVRRVN